ncbi:MAG TPA: TfoX/Sxy family protein [Vitreimonas sp.]|uniref:TfoX/Sxy family protein n=1 Tax=Vitreimonas sp. TaxID=3069702 RepID=UPI002D4D2CCA|nr:TfoX/Sxy family protein [Vitreimonas sp.]HYD86931.1 TfoX/Sxy family protein [Vitreimonas sp.]
MPHDPHLVELMREAMRRRAGVSERRMFGGYCWMLNGNMLCGVEVGRFMFRVGKEREAQALSRPGATPMDITGKPMRGIIWVDAGAAIDAGLDAWIDFASHFVGALEPK